MNLRDMLTYALQEGDTLENVLCFYQNVDHEHDYNNQNPIISCAGDQLPTREFDAGYGGKNGEPFVGYSDDWVYISVEYDGSEWISAVPRNPKMVKLDRPIASYGG